jgi:hypothetical protein
MKLIHLAEMLIGCLLLLGYTIWEALQYRPAEHPHPDTFDAR